MYADTITDSMREAIDETNRRRTIQMKVQRGARCRAEDRAQGHHDISSFIAEATENVGKRDRSRGDSLGHAAFFTPAGEGAADEAPGSVVSDGQQLAEELANLPKDELARIVATM